MSNPLQVLGISASPERGATQFLVRAALLGAQASGARVEMQDLAGRHVRSCRGCEPCLDVGSCTIVDDMTPLYAKLLAADVLIVGTPVYFGGPSALCQAFMERVEGLGIQEKKLRFKVGGAIAVAASDHGGQESAMAALHLWFQINEMIPIGITTPGAGWGVGGRAPTADEIVTSTVRATGSARSIRVAEAAWLYGRKLLQLANIVRAGLEQTGLDYPDRPYGANLPDSFPADLSDLRI